MTKERFCLNCNKKVIPNPPEKRYGHKLVRGAVAKVETTVHPCPHCGDATVSPTVAKAYHYPDKF